LFADEIFACEYSMLTPDNKQSFNISKNNELIFENLKSDLLGIYQRENILTVLATLSSLNIEISKERIYNGILNAANNTGLRGRWEILNHTPLTVCDTGHNIDGIKQVLKQIESTAYKKLHMIIGFVNDKNIAEILSILPKNADYYFTKPSIPRGLDIDILYDMAQQYNLHGVKVENVKKAINLAEDNADNDDFIFIGGSTFIVADVFSS